MNEVPNVQNPEDLLAALRELKQKVFSPELSASLKKESQEVRAEFVVERLRLTDTILRLETAQLSEIREQLEEQGEALNEGIKELTVSLGKMEQAAQWAQGLGKVLSIVSKVIPAL